MVKNSQGWCNYCGRRTLCQKNAPNHLLHFVLTICTGGLWGIVWIILCAANAGQYRCVKCGDKVR